MAWLTQCRILLVLSLAGLLLTQGACSSDAAEPANVNEPVDLYVFAAASLTDVLSEAVDAYRAESPEVNVILTLDASGLLARQIAAGAACDLFISASASVMDQLDAPSGQNPSGLDLIRSDTRADLLQNQLVLIVPAGNPAGVTAFADVAGTSVKTLALGNADVPAGQYARDLYTRLGLWDKLQSKISFGSNVKEVTTWVSENMADCGIVYSTDAAAAGLTVIETASAEMVGTPIIYPAAVMKNSKNPVVAAAFLDFLRLPVCTGIFKDAGFTVPSDTPEPDGSDGTA